MARPSLKTPEMVDAICERLANGEPLARICDDPAMPSFGTVWRWEKEDPEFRELSARAREIGTHYIADDCMRIADDSELETNDKKVRIDTRLRLIGKWNARGYGELVKLANADGSNLDLAARIQAGNARADG